MIVLGYIAVTSQNTDGRAVAKRIPLCQGYTTGINFIELESSEFFINILFDPCGDDSFESISKDSISLET